MFYYKPEFNSTVTILYNHREILIAYIGLITQLKTN